MRRLCLLAMVVACDAGPSGGPAGQWNVTLTCDPGPNNPPACADPPRIALRIADDSVSTGEHRSLFPGYPRPDGSYLGMPGYVSGAFEGVNLSLQLVPDLDDPFVSMEDVDAWTGHLIEIEGAFESACWEAEWRWIDPATEAIDAQGTATLNRHLGLCR